MISRVGCFQPPRAVPPPLSFLLLTRDVAGMCAAETGACARVSARLQPLSSSSGNAPDYDCDEEEEEEDEARLSGAVTGMKASSEENDGEFKWKIKAQKVRMMDRYGSFRWTFTASAPYSTGKT